MTKNVLYLGNNLSNPKTNTAFMQGLAAALEDEGYTVRCKSGYTAKVLRLLDMVGACFRFKTWADVVLIDTYSTQNFYYALAVSQCCCLLGLPYIPILHGGNLPQRLQEHPKLSERIFKNAKTLVSPSLYLQVAFENAGYSNVVYIPNSLNLEQYPFKTRTYDNIGLLWVRSFSNIYNPKLAVDILKGLQEKGYPTELCMVGPDTDGSLAEVKVYANRLGVQIKFTGKLSKAEWISLSKEYNLFINTTNFDNMPVSVIEAMVLGLPVVSTNVGGMPYLIEDGVDGVLVPPNNAQAFVSEIIRLVHHPQQTNTLAIQARKKVEGFDWELVKLKWIEVLG
ncbi:glycosyltransferase family 4 protein [Formosa sp. S-31]|uniref:glycosyltransferase family 4 protein n=1 Tax=Formosa sp. S-31 TaxID=2790949 RepID=UPI003EB88EB7